MKGGTGANFDVAILGAGMSGTVLGTILARLGVSVVLIDSETHPRFAIGESTTPHTSLLLGILAERYGVPELEDLAYPERVSENICTTCGIKRAFSWIYHRTGQEYDPRDGIQMGTTLKDENHLFRQDVDAYFFYLAVRYGAAHRLGTKIAGVNIDEGGVTLKTQAGEELRARYVVDGTGYKSVLAQAYDLREQPTRFKHHSRSLFTHMVDVEPFDEMGNPLAMPLHQTTLHHIFERGWFWVIPFNNRPGSTNPLVSVGLTIDPRRYPKSGLPPEQEFRQFLECYPSVARQFEKAKSVRPWVSTERLQYSSKSRTIGYRYSLMSHAAGAVDPLFSRGLTNTFEIIYALLDPLLNALETDDWALEPFSHIEARQQRVLDYNDRLVNCSFISWSDFELWNAWFRVWAFGTVLAEYRLMKALAAYTATHDVNCLKGEVSNPVFSEFEDPNYAEFFRRSAGEVEAYEAGSVTAPEATQRIFEYIGEYELPLPIELDALRRARWLSKDQEITERSLRFIREGFRWALGNPTSRDLYGKTNNLYRWRARQPDPHLVTT